MSLAASLGVGAVSAPQQPHLRVLTVNCGSGGIEASMTRIAAYATAAACDVVVFVEAHIAPGTLLTEIPGFNLIWNVRKSTVCVGQGRRRRVKGGVAFGVRTNLPVASHPVIVEQSQWADCSLLQLDTGDTHMYYICGLYLPPRGRAHCCNCTNVSCSSGLAHVKPVLTQLASWCDSYAPKGVLVVAGDFNCNWNVVRNNARRKEIHQFLAESATVDLYLTNPCLQRSLLLQPTRKDPVQGTESVLDLVFAVSNAPITTAVDNTTIVSDHYPLLTLVPRRMDAPIDERSTDTLLEGSGTDPVPRAWIRTSDWMKSGVIDSLSTLDAVQIAASIFSKVPSHPLSGSQDDIDSYAQQLEQAVESVLEDCKRQLCCKVGVIKAPKHAVSPPRFTETYIHAHKLVESLTAKIRRLERNGLAVPQELKDRRLLAWIARKEQRKIQHKRSHAWAHKRRLAVCNLLFTAWRTGQTRTVSGTLGGLASGRPHKPQPTAHTKGAVVRIQRKIRRLEVFLRAKYTASTQPTPERQAVADKLAAHRIRSRAKFQGAVLTSCRQPITAEELSRAVASLKPGSAATGLPIAAVKLLAPHLASRLIALFQAVFDSGYVPKSFCAVKATPIHKGGDIEDLANYRFIGVGSALSRIFQNVVLGRLTSAVHKAGGLSENQFGFRDKSSTEMATLLARGAVAAHLSMSAGPVYSCFVDIKGAYPSCNHDVIMTRLEDIGIPAELWLVVDCWFRNQTMFVQIGRHTGRLFPVTISVTEGGTFSPLLYNIIADTFVRELEKAGLRFQRFGACLSLSADKTLSSVWFADDGFINSSTPCGLQWLLDVLGRASGVVLFLFNVAPNKTAIVIHYNNPLQRPRPGTVPVFTLNGVPVPVVAQYKHLGSMWHEAGRRASAQSALAPLSVKCAAVCGRVYGSGISSLAVLHGLHLYTTWWLPTVMPTLPITFDSVPECVTEMEATVLRVLLGTGSSFCPLAVMQSIVGLPSLQTRVDLMLMRILIQMISTHPGSLVRTGLAQQVSVFVKGSVATQQSLWWSGIHRLLDELDACVSIQLHDNKQGRWSTVVTCIALSATASGVNFIRVLQAVTRQYKPALLKLEQKRQLKTLSVNQRSLGEVGELLVGPNFAPFILQPRNEACQWRIRLRSGRLGAFGGANVRLAVCPWCDKADGFRVKHLVRDCPYFEGVRVMWWTKAARICVEAHLMDAHDLLLRRHEWYLITVGARVSSAFFRVGLDVPTHFARHTIQPVPAGFQSLRSHCREYVEVLRLTGEFLCYVMNATNARVSAQRRWV